MFLYIYLYISYKEYFQSFLSLYRGLLFYKSDNFLVVLKIIGCRIRICYNVKNERRHKDEQ